MSEYLIDLDELVLRCKDEEARKYIAEAIVCYKSGAFRASIVTTWIAVVYDFVHKLRELERTGDKNARVKLNEFEEARKNKTPELALTFERSLLKWARDEFEFLSPLQYDDLERLLADRNRCAHPSMISAEEIYNPPAELARYHLRNAITHLLQHPPVQGQAALERLHKDTLSEYFPSNTEDAIGYLQHGPLANAKPALVRNFTVSLLKTLMKDTHDSPKFQRFAAALNATRQMHREVTEETLSNQVSKIVQQLDDAELIRIVIFLRVIPDSWQFLDRSVRTRLNNFVLSVQDEVNLGTILDHAFDIPDLRNSVEKRLPTLSQTTLQELVKSKRRPEFVLQGIQLYSQVGTFSSANELANEVLIPLMEYMKSEDVERIIACAGKNSQVLGSYQFREICSKFIIKGVTTNQQMKQMFKDNNISDDMYYTIFPDEYIEPPQSNIPF